MIETVVALLLFVNGEIKEHRIQDSMATCLKRRRIAEREIKPSITYKCLSSKMELEVNVDGSKSIKKIILE